MTRRSWSVLLLVVVLASCAGSDGPTASPATIGAGRASSTTSTTEAPKTPEEEVEAAYLKSWDVYAKAKRELTTDGLDCCFAGDQLRRTRADIEDRIRTVRPAKVSVDHDYEVQLLAPDVAVVRDRYRNHSVLVDPDSGKATEPDPNDVYVETYTLRKLEGLWKVTDIVRESPPSSS